MLFSTQLQNGPQDFIFPIALRADYLFELNSIETYVSSFLDIIYS